jgi:hypothetical protein
VVGKMQLLVDRELLVNLRSRSSALYGISRRVPAKPASAASPAFIHISQDSSLYQTTLQLSAIRLKLARIFNMSNDVRKFSIHVSRGIVIEKRRTKCCSAFLSVCHTPIQLKSMPVVAQD